MNAVETTAALVTESVLVEPIVSAADGMSVLVVVTVEDTTAAAVVVSISVVVIDVDGTLVFISGVGRVSVVTGDVDVSIE